MLSKFWFWFTDLFTSNRKIYWAISPPYEQKNENGIYKMHIFLWGLKKNKFAVKDVRQISIDTNEIFLSNVWTMVMREGNDYHMQVPIWLDTRKITSVDSLE